jgi:hypothetical protein
VEAVAIRRWGSWAERCHRGDGERPRHFYYSLIHSKNEYASLMVELSTSSTAETSKSAISEIVVNA